MREVDYSPSPPGSPCFLVLVSGRCPWLSLDSQVISPQDSTSLGGSIPIPGPLTPNPLTVASRCRLVPSQARLAWAGSSATTGPTPATCLSPGGENAPFQLAEALCSPTVGKEGLQMKRSG